MKSEFYGVLTKVFYSGNAKRNGGEYTLTFLDIDSKEEIVVYVKVRIKIEFDVKNQFVYRVVHDQGSLLRMIIVSKSVKDYLAGNYVDKQVDVINDVKQRLAFVLHWFVVIVVFAIISYFLIGLFNK